jgi:N utilization substance protein A
MDIKMKNELFDLVEVLKSVAQGKNVETEVVVDSLKEAIVSAAKKYLKSSKRIEVEIDPETHAISVFLRVQVVEDYPDVPEDADADTVAKMDEGYMLLEEAREYNEEAAVGDLLEMEMPIEAFGRQAIQTAKQFLIQKVRDAERNKIFDTYKSKVGTLISGVVQQVDRGNILVNLGRAEGVLPIREQIRRERFRQGDSIQAYIAEVTDAGKGAQVILSRAHNQFLAELFKLEVPEIYDGVVEIRGISRDPGFRAKIAVFSRDDRIDPVGACVGMKGNRVQSIVRELSNERIDIVNWTDDLQTFIKRSLSPANIVKIIEVPGTRRVVVVVENDDLAQAIGRNGQNIRLASQLTGRDLDIYGEVEYSELSDEQRQSVLSAKPDDSGIKKTKDDSSEDKNKFSELDALFKKSEV